MAKYQCNFWLLKIFTFEPTRKQYRTWSLKCIQAMDDYIIGGHAQYTRTLKNYLILIAGQQLSHSVYAPNHAAGLFIG